MEKSEKIDVLAKALATVQSQLEGAKKDSTNPFFKSKYADLASAWGACRDLLSANGFSVVQTSSAVEGRDFVLDTVLLHESGQWISGQLPVPLTKQDPQGLGSAMTYARRYSLMAIVGICPEDDDAESAVKREPDKKEPIKKSTKKEQEETGNPYTIKWYAESAKIAGISPDELLTYIKETFKVEGDKPSEAIENLNLMQRAEFSQYMLNKRTQVGK